MTKRKEKIDSGENEILDGTINPRGRKFEGFVIKKFDKRVVIEFERVKLIKKYERYIKTETRMHARLPEKLRNEINVGDYIQIQECRPLSKILHHIVIKKIRSVNVKSGVKNESN